MAWVSFNKQRGANKTGGAFKRVHKLKPFREAHLVVRVESLHVLERLASALVSAAFLCKTGMPERSVDTVRAPAWQNVAIH